MLSLRTRTFRNKNPSQQVRRHRVTRKAIVENTKTENNFNETITASNLSNNLRVVTSTHGYEKGLAGVAVVLDAGTGNAKNSSVGALYGRLLRNACSDKLEALGVSFDVFQTREETGVYVKCASGKVENVLKEINQILNGNFKESDLAKAKGEQNQVVDVLAEDIGHDYLIDHAHACAFQGLPLGHGLYGEEEDIRAVTLDDVNSFVEDNVAADRVVVSASGDVDAETVNKAAQVFDALPAGSGAARNNEVDFVGSEAKIRDELYDGLSLTVAWQGPERSSDDYHTALVLNEYLGQFSKDGGAGAYPMSPVVEIYTENEMVDDVSSFYSAYDNNGMIGCSFKLNLDDEHGAWHFYRVFSNQIKRLALVPANDVEIERVQNGLIDKLYKQAVHPGKHAADIASTTLRCDDYKGVDFETQRIRNVTNKDMAKLADDRLVDNCPVITSYGVNYFLPDYYHMRGMLK